MPERYPKYECPRCARRAAVPLLLRAASQLALSTLAAWGLFDLLVRAAEVVW